MAETIIKAEKLSKRYYIHNKEAYYSLRDALVGLFTLKSFRRSNDRHEFWALKDLNFEIKAGDTVGIIGRNGAGKSTLLKILSQINPPTSGKITMGGRVASLLEVGTGFHPELTGRENVYLNGAILGMTQKEIQRQFDNIVAFAEIEEFLDTPVKRYSSGMYVRLAFAVAVHLQPEILIIDEVLAVGDAQFQKKCLAKMQEVAKSGRTVIFVSHNMTAVSQLCNKCIYLKEGRLEMYGDTKEVLDRYMNVGLESAAAIDLERYNARNGNGKYRFKSVKLQDSSGNVRQEFSVGEDISLSFELEHLDRSVNDLKLAVELRSSDGLKIANMINTDSLFKLKDPDDERTVTVTLKDVRFYPDIYYISLWAGDDSASEDYDYVLDCVYFNITDGGKLTSRPLPRSAGLLFMTPKWEEK